MVFSQIELALINFDGCVRTTNLNRAALRKHQHGIPAEHAPARHYVGQGDIRFVSWWFIRGTRCRM